MVSSGSSGANCGTARHKGQLLIGPIAIMFAHVELAAELAGASAISKSGELHCLYDVVPK
jgi:hypothetical protein